MTISDPVLTYECALPAWIERKICSFDDIHAIILLSSGMADNWRKAPSLQTDREYNGDGERHDNR